MFASTVAENVSTASLIESINLSTKRPMIARNPADDCKRLQVVDELGAGPGFWWQLVSSQPRKKFFA